MFWLDSPSLSWMVAAYQVYNLTTLRWLRHLRTTLLIPFYCFLLILIVKQNIVANAQLILPSNDGVFESPRYEKFHNLNVTNHQATMASIVQPYMSLLGILKKLNSWIG